MKMLRVIPILALLVAGASSYAMGNVFWTFNDVMFSNGATVTGEFTTNDAVNTYLDFSITVSDPNGWTVAHMTDANLPTGIGAGNTDFSKFFFLIPSSPLTGDGGVVTLSSGVECAGAGPCFLLLLPEQGHNPEVIGVVPEHSALLNLDVIGSMGLLGFVILRRKA